MKKNVFLFFSTLLISLYIAAENNANPDDVLTRACCKTSARACAPTPITTITTITTPGAYCLANDLSGTTTLITISSSSVLIDLNSHSLNAQSGANGIGFDGILGRSDVIIKNGTIDGSNGGSTGILLATPLSGVTPEDLNERGIVISDLLIKNFTDGGIATSSIASFLLSDTATPYYPLSSLTIDNCTIFDSNGSLGLFGAQDVIIRNSNLSSNESVGAIFETCFNMLIEDSFFNRGAFGLLAVDVSEMTIENSFFNFNTFGLVIGGGTNITCRSCSFNENDFLGFLEGLLIQGSNPPSGLSFTDCSFNENALAGFIVGSVSGMRLLTCQANNNGELGFTLFESATDSVLENCMASGNAGIGFYSLTTDGMDVSLNGCIAKDNVTGFELSPSTGSGVIQACKALGNSFCGFNDRAGTLYQYISNVAQGNGSGPAQDIDSNYCLDNGPTEYTPITGGPGISAPFNQLGRSNVTNMFNAGISSWDNVTLQ